MAYRAIPTTNREMEYLLREMLDRLDRLEQGGAIAGEVSFGETILIGDVEVIVTDTGGGSRTVTFRSPSGAQSVITL